MQLIRGRMALKPFARGGMRMCLHLVLLDAPAGSRNFVAKTAIVEAHREREVAYEEVAMQAHAAALAEEFNKRDPPKPIAFVDSWVIEVVSVIAADPSPSGSAASPSSSALTPVAASQTAPLTAPGAVFTAEPLITGKYVKHTNNAGWISPADRNTPSAFSHFTYCFTDGDKLVCDIQGVGDLYTDPQIHCRDTKRFGQGNLGVEGMLRFFATHYCNSICNSLCLPVQRAKAAERGTVVRSVLGSVRDETAQMTVPLPPTKPPPEHERAGQFRKDAAVDLPTGMEVTPAQLQVLNILPSDLESVKSAFTKLGAAAVADPTLPPGVAPRPDEIARPAVIRVLEALGWSAGSLSQSWLSSISDSLDRDGNGFVSFWVRFRFLSLEFDFGLFPCYHFRNFYVGGQGHRHLQLLRCRERPASLLEDTIFATCSTPL